MDLKFDGDIITRNIKSASWFPYRSGHLKHNATKGYLANSNTYVIAFDATIAPYIDALEYGSKAHNIPGAFGKALPFGTSGRFNGMFHPGSFKHKGFIGEKSVRAVISYFINKYGGYEA